MLIYGTSVIEVGRCNISPLEPIFHEVTFMNWSYDLLQHLQPYTAKKKSDHYSMLNYSQNNTTYQTLKKNSDKVIIMCSNVTQHRLTMI